MNRLLPHILWCLTILAILSQVENLHANYFDQFKSVEIDSKVDPATPPQYLRLRTTSKEGKPLTLFLIKHSILRDWFTAELRHAGGEFTTLDAGPVRTYRGWVEELPDTLVGAYLQKDGQIASYLLRPVFTKGDGSPEGTGPGQFTAGEPEGYADRCGAILVPSQWSADEPAKQDFQYLSGPPVFKFGKACEGASFIKANPSGDPFFEQATLLDQAFITNPTFFLDRNNNTVSDHAAGYQKYLMSFETTSLVYDLISLRDGLSAFRIGHIAMVRPDPMLTDEATGKKQFNSACKTILSRMAKPVDAVAKTNPLGGGGSGSLKRLNANMGYVTSANWSQHVMAHELGHLFNWGGDHCGRGVEGGLLGGGGNRMRYGTPAVRGRRDVRLAHRQKSEWSDLIEFIPTPEFPLTPYARCEQVKGGFEKPLYIDVLANDFDANGGMIAISGFESNTRESGTVTLAAKQGPDGRDTLKYAPAPGFLGEDRFSYCIVDSDGRIGYGNVIVYVAAPKRILAHYTFDDCDQYHEYDGLRNSVDPALSGHTGVNWHKHRTSPFVAIWGIQRNTGRGGYYDHIKSPIYEFSRGTDRDSRQAFSAPWNRKEFKFNISGLPYIESDAGIYDITFHRWRQERTGGAFNGAWYIKNPPDLIVHDIKLLINGKPAAYSDINKPLVITPEPPANPSYPDTEDSKGRLTLPFERAMNTGRQTFRLKTKELNTEFKEALRAAAGFRDSKDYNRWIKECHPVPENMRPDIPGPKVELAVTMSKTEGHFSGGIMMTPVDPDLEKVQGKFGNCLKIHGYDQFNYVSIPDGNNYKTIAFWSYVPKWDLRHDPYLIKYLGKFGVTNREVDGNVKGAYCDVHATSKEWNYFAPLPEKKWFHTAVVLGEDVKVFIDGEQVVQAARLQAKPPMLGRLGFNITAAFDDLQIYSGALTSTDIREIMKGESE